LPQQPAAQLFQSVISASGRIFRDVGDRGDKIQRKTRADYRLPLLHDDGDFDPMVKFLELEVIEA